MTDPTPETLRLYTDMAAWWPLLSAPEDYVEEAAFFARTLSAACVTPPASVLELGSGGGNNAFHLKRHFTPTLVDLSPGMLDVSRALNPELEHVPGDMRTVRLGREFDAVFVHDAICYMTTPTDLRLAVDTAFAHCRVGGAALFVPDHVRETFSPSTDCGGHDGEERSLRYLEWTWDPDPDDDTCTVDYTFVMRDGDGPVTVEHDRQLEGVFSTARWLETLAGSGFEPEFVPWEHSELPGSPLVAFVGRRRR